MAYLAVARRHVDASVVDSHDDGVVIAFGRY